MSTTVLWTSDPYILLQNDELMNIFPTKEMNYDQKVNSIARFILYVTIISFFITQNYWLLIFGFILLIIMYFYILKKTENFKVINKITNITKPLHTFLKEKYEPIQSNNPFNNVLLTDIVDNPNRKSAPPAFQPEVSENITKNIKRAIQKMNPTIINTNKQLYGDLWEKFQLDQSNRAFFSTANTEVVNNQNAFAQWLYGSMPSAKEDNILGNLQRILDNQRYILY